MRAEKLERRRIFEGPELEQTIRAEYRTLFTLAALTGARVSEPSRADVVRRAPGRRRGRRDRVRLASGASASLGAAAGGLAALLVSERTTLFGFMEHGYGSSPRHFSPPGHRLPTEALRSPRTGGTPRRGHPISPVWQPGHRMLPVTGFYPDEEIVREREQDLSPIPRDVELYAHIEGLVGEENELLEEAEEGRKAEHRERLHAIGEELDRAWETLRRRAERRAKPDS